MPYVVAFLAALTVLLIVLGYLQQRRHSRELVGLFAAFREERAQLINKIVRPEQPIPDGRPTPTVRSRRTPESQRELSRVGTVAPPRPPDGAES